MWYQLGRESLESLESLASYLVVVRKVFFQDSAQPGESRSEASSWSARDIDDGKLVLKYQVGCTPLGRW